MNGEHLDYFACVAFGTPRLPQQRATDLGNRCPVCSHAR